MPFPSLILGIRVPLWEDRARRGRRCQVENFTKYVPCGLRERVGFKGIPQRLKPLSSQTNTARLKSCPSRALFLASVCRFGSADCPAFRGFRQVGVDAAGVKALRGAEAPLFHGTTLVLLVLRKIQDQRQRLRTGVSDSHWQFGSPKIPTGLFFSMFRLPCFPFRDGDTGIGRSVRVCLHVQNGGVRGR